MSEIEGFMPADGLDVLRKYAAGKNVLEIGCWKGRTAAAMAQTAKRVVTIDHFRGDNYVGRPVFTFPEAFHNLKDIENVTIMRGDFRTVLPTLNVCSFDLLFYDGDHDYEPTKAFFELVLPWARPEQILILDDYNEGYPQVVRAVAEQVVKADGTPVMRHRQQPPCPWHYSLSVEGSLAILTPSI